MIKLREIKKYYGGRCVLDIAHLDLAAGERCALLGANGSGKSTLLRILAGVLEAEQGTVSIPEALARGRGHMPQRPYSFGFSVLKNVSMAAEGEEDARKALEAVGMGGMAQAKGGDLSGGEAQRMAFARMIVRDRPLLLLDEPTSAMDIAGSDLVEKALLEYCARTGCTLLFSTHSLAQAQRLARRALLLDEGRVAEDGPVERVLYQPESEQARKFLRFWKLEGKRE